MSISAYSKQVRWQEALVLFQEVRQVGSRSWLRGWDPAKGQIHSELQRDDGGLRTHGA